MNSSIIVFANQKGGVGKTTLSISLSNMLAARTTMPVTLIDCDAQKSASKRRFAEMETHKDAIPQYQIVAIPLENDDGIRQLIGKIRKQEGLFIFDTPPSLDYQGLISLLSVADLTVCPLTFDPFTLASTIEFILLRQKICASILKATGAEHKGKLVFMPNKHRNGVGKQAELKSWECFRDTASKYGDFSPPVPDRADIGKRLSTLGWMDNQEDLLHEPMDYLCQHILQQK